MFATIMPGFRDLRASLVAGSLLVGSLFVLVGEHLPAGSALRPEMREVFGLHSLMPVIVVVVMCALVGSLYTTALEGAVDALHRRYLSLDPGSIPHPAKRRLMAAVNPFSSMARSRLINEAGRFYDHTEGDHLVTRQQFQSSVLGDVLWLEGKLVGTALKDPHDQYRSEGELRLASGIVIPLCAAAVFYGTRAHPGWLSLAVLAGIAIGLWQVNYGLYYYKRANSFLAHHIADGNLRTPTMESLSRK